MLLFLLFKFLCDHVFHLDGKFLFNTVYVTKTLFFWIIVSPLIFYCLIFLLNLWLFMFLIRLLIYLLTFLRL